MCNVFFGINDKDVLMNDPIVFKRINERVKWNEMNEIKEIKKLSYKQINVAIIDTIVSTTGITNFNGILTYLLLFETLKIDTRK